MWIKSPTTSNNWRSRANRFLGVSAEVGEDATNNDTQPRAARFGSASSTASNEG